MTSVPPTPSIALEHPEHEEVAVFWHRASGLLAVVAIHSTVRGPSLGGSRFRQYPTLDAAVTEACNLSEAMTYKAAVAGLPQGGGKAVLVGDPSIAKTRHLLVDYASVLDSLGGRYITAEDVGTTQADMDLLSEHTRYVAGTSVEKGGSGDPSPVTAFGVFRAMQGAWAHAHGSDDLSGVRVAVSGLGKVGAELTRLLAGAGAKLTIADVSDTAVQSVLVHGSADVVNPAVIHATECDIFAPCALGYVLNDVSVPELRCQMVVGAANNQLSSAEIADALLDRGVTYVPDFVANAGGIINIAHEHGGYDESSARAQVSEIYATTRSILERADQHGITPLSASIAIAKERLVPVS